MIRVFTSKTQKIGELGENLAVKFLKREGFTIVCQNYTKKQGEIDIIAKKQGILYFFEVKASVARKYVSHETYNPAENMHLKKIQKFLRTVEIYLLEKNVSCETRVILLSVLINKENKKAKVQMIDF